MLKLFFTPWQTNIWSSFVFVCGHDNFYVNVYRVPSVKKYIQRVTGEVAFF